MIEISASSCPHFTALIQLLGVQSQLGVLLWINKFWANSIIVRVYIAVYSVNIYAEGSHEVQ